METGKVTITPTGEFMCPCGNSPEQDGAYPCDGDGIEVMPDDNWSDLYRCDRCGVIFNGDTGDIISKSTVEQHAGEL